MGRFFIGLLVASLLFWAYDSWGREALAERTAAGPLDLPAFGGLSEIAAGQASPAATAEAQPVAAGEATIAGAAAELAESVKPAQPGPGAMATKVARALTPLERIEADGAFLHSEAGRNLARRALELALSKESGAALGDSTRILQACMKSEIQKSDVEARALVDEVYAKHKILVRRVVFNPGNGERAHRYLVKAGDTLGRIAASYNSSHGLKLEGDTLAVINRISDPRSLQQNQILRVPIDPIRVVIEKKSFLCGVYLGEDLVRLYWCSHGREEHETPVTSFIVAEKLFHPDWFYGGRQVPYGAKDNPLGTHFVKFRHDSLSGFGIHGTVEPDRMLERISLGCIRLVNEDIAEFFRLVPRGARVLVR